MITRCILLWLPLPLVAIANGILRNAVYQRALGTSLAHQVSTGTGIGLFALYASLVRSWCPLHSLGQALMVGVIWLALTVAFEFLFFHFVMGQTWIELLKAYHIWEGELWVLILIWVFVLPPLMFYVRR